jgi:ABC-2 type transport system permease protein
MRRMFLVLGNDIRRHLKAPLVIIIFIAIPLIMTGLIGLVFGPRTEDSQLPPIPVLLVDKDQSLVGRLMMGAFGAGELKAMFQVTATDEGEGRRRMAAGKASAMIVIPERFTPELLESRPVSLTVIKNPAEQFLPDVVEEFVNTMAVMLSAMVQAFADEARGIRAMLDSPLGSFSWEALAPELGKAQKKMIAAEKYLNPLLIRLKEEKTQAAGSKTQFTQVDLFSAILPGMAIMFLLFIVQNVMRDILSEREDGKLRRMMTTPLRPLELISARLLGGWLMGMIVLLVMVAAGALVFHVKWGPFGYFLILGAAACFWTAALFGLLHALFRNRNQAGALSAPIILVFSLFGGSMMSPEAMPKTFRAVGALTPNRWFIDGAALIREGRFPWAALAVLAASGLVLMALAVPALRRRTAV